MVGELTELTGAPATGKTQVGGWLVAYLTVPTVHVVTCGGYTYMCSLYPPISALPLFSSCCCHGDQQYCSEGGLD